MPKPRIDDSEQTPLLSESRLKWHTPLPKLQMAILLIIQLCEPLASNSIFPYINQGVPNFFQLIEISPKLIAELDITGGDKRKVGYYAGLIESLFFATQAMTVLQWGRISDRIGRKPILLIGMAGSALSVLCFGLSRTFVALVVSRCLCGILNGNAGVMKSVRGELTDSTNRADSLALLAITWSIGATIAPAIGGSLSRVHERFPAVFAGTFWGDYPYFLPCLVVSIFVSISFLITFFFFEETLPLPCFLLTSSDETPPCGRPSPLSLRDCLTFPVIISVSNYVTFSFLEIASVALLPLFMSTPVEFGGMGCSPAVIGYVLGALGAYLGIFQILFFARLVRRFGEKRLFIAGAISITLVNSCFLPLINFITRENGVTWLAWSVLGLALILKAGSSTAFGVIYIYINAASPNKSSLGTTNGIAQTAVSFARAFGPGLATSLFAVSLEKNLLGGYAVYAVLFLFSCVLLFLSIRLPAEVWEECD